MTVRPARPEDRPAIAAIQQESREAAQWDPTGYDVQVAERLGAVVGFLVTRAVAPDEIEILNLAVAPVHRRSGVARALVMPLLESVHGDVFLEVRESNCNARNFYKSIGFTEVSLRQEYYDCPREGGIVMNFHSC